MTSSFFDTEALRSLAFGGPWPASDFAAFSFSETEDVRLCGGPSWFDGSGALTRLRQVRNISFTMSHPQTPCISLLDATPYFLDTWCNDAVDYRSNEG